MAGVIQHLLECSRERRPGEPASLAGLQRINQHGDSAKGDFDELD